MPGTLPKKLNKEPLIDAVFEIRFSSSAQASNVLPGFLFSKLDGEKSIEQLPTAGLPKPVRDADPNLHFAPLVKLNWNNFAISLSDRSLIVGCKLPYPGWDNFKKTIIEVIKLVKEIGIIENIERFSIKYVDLIPATELGEQVSLISTSIVIGGHTLEKESFSLRIEIPKDDVLHVVSIVSSAAAKLQDGTIREGIIVDVDTIVGVQNQKFGDWSENLSNNLDEIHLKNKEMFFKCLRTDTIESLEPIYE